MADRPSQLLTWDPDVWSARRFVQTAFVIDVVSVRIVDWRTTGHAARTVSGAS
ncbi:MAG: hypothetical protein R6U94_14015 [Nitriliruptoraceae bacterium]